MDRISAINRVNNKYRGSGFSPAGVFPGSAIPVGVSPIAGTSIRRSRIITGGPSRTVAGLGSIVGGVSTLRTSKVMTPPIYNVVTNPPIYG